MGADRRGHGSESGARVPRGALGDASLRDVGIPATRAARRAPARRAGASRPGGRPVRGLSSSSACRCARRQDRGRPGAGRGCAGMARGGTPRRRVARRLGRARRRARAGGSLDASRRRVRRSGLRVARSPGAGPHTQSGDGACSRGTGGSTWRISRRWCAIGSSRRCRSGRTASTPTARLPPRRGWWRTNARTGIGDIVRSSRCGSRSPTPRSAGSRRRRTLRTTGTSHGSTAGRSGWRCSAPVRRWRRRRR